MQILLKEDLIMYLGQNYIYNLISMQVYRTTGETTNYCNEVFLICFTFTMCNFPLPGNLKTKFELASPKR